VMKRESTEEVRARLLADEEVRSMIEMRAYEIYELRGCAPGREAEDWIQAEGEILKFVIEEEFRMRSQHYSFEEPAAIEPPFVFPPYEATEKRMEIFTIVETEVNLSANPSAEAETSRTEVASKRAATPAKSSSREGSKKSASAGRKGPEHLKPPKGFDKKSSGKGKDSRKTGKTKQSRHRSSELEKDK